MPSNECDNLAACSYFIHLNRLIERSGGSRKALKGEGPQPKFDLLTDNGNWRLIFTTGDVKTQEKLGGKLTYVPIKAVQVSCVHHYYNCRILVVVLRIAY